MSRLILEVTKEGKILVTDLTNYATYFIRYEIGDIAEGKLLVSDCRLNKFDLLPGVLGRQSDIFVNKKGDLVDMTAVTTLIYKVPGIKQVQFIQHSETLIEAKVVPEDSFKEENLYEILEPFFPDLTLKVNFVTAIPRSKSGKYIFAKRLINE